MDLYEDPAIWTAGEGGGQVDRQGLRADRAEEAEAARLRPTDRHKEVPLGWSAASRVG